MEFEIRPVRAEDHQAVLALSPRLTIGAPPWRDPARFAAAARGWIETSLASAEDAGHAVFVAVRGGRVAGVVSVAEREHFTGDRDAYVGELVTGAAVEGRGAGRALMAAAQHWAAQRGLYRITLETGAANERARRFYASLGYEEEEIRLSKPVDPAGVTGRERRA
jgi:ribosomal protein S18 acetylase RimI-like enzyme